LRRFVVGVGSEPPSLQPGVANDDDDEIPLTVAVATGAVGTRSDGLIGRSAVNHGETVRREHRARSTIGFSATLCCGISHVTKS